jgi:predicted permease
MSAIVEDIRYALRRIRREPGFAIFATLIVALGVGAVTAVFSVMSPLMLRPLPFRESERLAWVANAASGGMSSVTSRVANLRDYRERAQSFEAMTGYFAFFDYGSYNLVGDGPPERLIGAGIAQDFLDVLGVRPLLGRGFTTEESVWNGRPAAILTHEFWMRRFGGDPKVLGQKMVLNNQSTEIVGVLPQTFDFASTFAPASHVDFLTPFPIADETDRWGNTLAIIGRLKPGVTIERAQAELDRINRELKEADPNRWGLRATVSALQDHIAGNFRAPLLVLVAAAGLVLAVACVNLSNLLLARAHRRAAEMSVRSALGASRGRLISQLLTESLILAVCGGAAGALLAFIVTEWVASTAAISIPMLRTISIDGTALGVALVLTLVTGLVIGIAPALQVSHGQEASTLKEASRGASEGRRSAAVREALVVGEVALACVLLIDGGLLLRSFIHVLDVDLGFRPEGRVVWEIGSQREFPNNAARVAFYEDVADRVRAVPGVEAVGLTDTPPLGRNREWGIRAKGRVYKPNEGSGAFPRLVDSRYLEVMGIAVVAGRHFTPKLTETSPKEIILNQTAAADLFPGLNPIGQVVLLGDGEWPVVGVAADVRHQSLEQGSGSEMYYPLAQNPDFSTLAMVVRSRLPLSALAGGVRAALRTADPAMPTDDFHPLGAVVDRAISPRRFVLEIIGAFAGAALLLAALGIYAVLSYSVSQRTREIGIRIALGETSARVRQRVVGRTVRLAAIGVVLGCALAFAASRLLQSLLYGVGPADVVSFAGTAVLLVAVSALAGYLPARRASMTDPVEALRST